MPSQQLNLGGVLDVDDFGDDLVRRHGGPLAARVEPNAARRQREAGQEPVEFGLARLMQDDLAGLACRRQILVLRKQWCFSSSCDWRRYRVVDASLTDAATEVTPSWW